MPQQRYIQIQSYINMLLKADQDKLHLLETEPKIALYFFDSVLSYS